MRYNWIRSEEALVVQFIISSSFTRASHATRWYANDFHSFKTSNNETGCEAIKLTHYCTSFNNAFKIIIIGKKTHHKACVTAQVPVPTWVPSPRRMSMKKNSSDQSGEIGSRVRASG